MVNKSILKQILASNQKDVENYQVVPRELPSDEFGTIEVMPLWKWILDS